MDSAPHSSPDDSPTRSDELSGAELGSSDEEESLDSGNYSQCRSTNFSSGRSWYQSPDHEFIFGGSSDLAGYLHDSGGSLDAFLDALEDSYSDSEKQRDLNSTNSQSGHAGTVRGTGLFEDEEQEDEIHSRGDDSTGVQPEKGGNNDIQGGGESSNDEHLNDVGAHVEKAGLQADQSRLEDSSDDNPLVIPQKLDEQVQEEPSDEEAAKNQASVSDPEVNLELEPGTTVNPIEETSVHQKTSVQLIEKKKCVMRLGSREAEDLLQLDVEEIVKPLRQQQSEPAVDWSREHLGPDELSRYVETPEVRETYMDTVWDMEDVLLDRGESIKSHSFWTGKDPGSPVKNPGKTTSVYDGLWRVDSVEVIGARQRRGGASLGERVVGIREHTIYRILVRSGGKEWEIERRYREFVDLYHQMSKMFSTGSRVRLPSPWERVTPESRKLFGNTSPDVVEIRSALLQVCLQTSVQSGVPISTAAPLLRFLFPSPGETRLPMLTVNSQFSPPERSFSMPLQEFGGASAAGASSESPRCPEVQESPGSLGRTIRLVLQVQSRKPLRQQLLNQRSLCAGCFEQLNSPVSLLTGIGKSLGWGNPRFCEYTGQLFCSRCHANETAILPARVLQSWDFTPRPVSQLAKAYLDSIYDQPMLCVSAVNPFLYSKVPILAHLRDTRRRLSRLVECIHCPSRSKIQQHLGPRRYLLEYNDFYALRDLADLSKGAFAVLPGLLRATLEKLSFHVTRKCSVCLEMAEHCGAGIVCCDPSDLIYPFQEDGVHRCQLCSTFYHTRCFKMIETCKVCTRDSPTKHQQHQQQQQRTSRSVESRESSLEFSPEEDDSSSKSRRSLIQAESLASKDRSNSTVLNMSAIL